MISQLFVLSVRGDTLLYRDYRGDIPKEACDIFFRNVQANAGLEPVWTEDGIHFNFVKQGNMYFVATTLENISPVLVMELLHRVTRVLKDYCGVLSEDSIRLNFVLAYEILDEMLDFGYIQGTSTEHLKTFIYNEAVPVETETLAQAAQRQADRVIKKITKGKTEPKTVSSTAVHRPIATGRKQKSNKEEIFIDVLERLSVTFNSAGGVVASQISGSIQLKSYLSGNPELILALNDDLVIGRGTGYGSVVLDDVNFHECVREEHFARDRSLLFFPPDGEFVLMNYRISSDFAPPIRIFPFIEQTGDGQLDVVVKVRAEIPEQNYGINTVISIPVPKSTASVSCDLGAGTVGESAEFNRKQNVVEWKVKKFQGHTEHVLRAKVVLQRDAQMSRAKREVGPVSMKFEIPMINASRLQVKFLRFADQGKNYHPHRWVRYITQTDSYVARTN
eukprot:CAMPEP_0113880030 /NCGR_PEP_ID=MMETSP0780_2-20120614/7560_1 /TAXON_ID=652834 /ORGANISM="Palpitomonas bilix" /LENGTH=447 /DNA_ID=CAMNT_0000866663 /DNA_START=181 /DNA_END=1524 /DNA_ORIENTATION=+ /assembly_acc=CAM_ASM_000599